MIRSGLALLCLAIFLPLSECRALKWSSCGELINSTFVVKLARSLPDGHLPVSYFLLLVYHKATELTLLTYDLY